MACVTRFQVLRGTSAQRVAMIPLMGELVFDTDLKTMFVGDGVTYGGNPFSGEVGAPATAIYTTNTVVTGIDYAIGNSATPITFTLPDASVYLKPINFKNINTGEVTLLPTGGQSIYVKNAETDVQLKKGEACQLVPKSGAWYLW